jgi:hypothetical protein
MTTITYDFYGVDFRLSVNHSVRLLPYLRRAQADGPPAARLPTLGITAESGLFIKQWCELGQRVASLRHWGCYGNLLDGTDGNAHRCSQ